MKSPAAGRQPVQTLYQGAHLFDEGTLERTRAEALAAMDRHAPDGDALRAALGGDDTIARVHARVRARIEQRPLDDYRLDFEDGYGTRPDADEDAEAERAARAVGRALSQMPGSFGIRVKPLNGTTAARGLRTTERFVEALVDACGGLPPGFVLTLPKVSVPEEAGVFADTLDALESRLGLAAGALRFEYMVELPQIVIGPDGTCPLRRVVEAGRGRIVAAHFGTYDYTAACGIAAAHQSMHHPACEFAKQVMRVAHAGTDVWLSDGSTNVLPVEPHVHAAWKRHYDDVSGSLVRGFMQGWDLHPAQLVTRYAALYVFYRSGFDAAAARLSAMLSPKPAAGGGFLDDPATGQALLGYVRRAVECGAVDASEAARQTGLSAEELSGGSFVAVQAARASGRR